MLPVPAFEVGKIDDYRAYLSHYNSDFIEDEFYLNVGCPSRSHGWILHISFSVIQAEALINKVFPLLFRFSFPFKIIRDAHLHDLLNTGSFGPYKTGKVITVYFDDQVNIQPFMNGLIPLTNGFVGPIVLTDFPITKALYVRYGSFIKLIDLDSFGNRVVFMEDSKGHRMIDSYSIPPIVPSGIYNSFVSFVDLAALHRKSPMIGNRAFPLKQLKWDVKGNVWLGLYRRKPFLFRLCVIKQGVAGMFADLLGRDMMDRMEVQSRAAVVLNGKLNIPRLIDYFVESGRAYLVMKYIWWGKDLIAKVRGKFKNIIWFEQRFGLRLEFLEYYIKIVKEIIVLHRLGYVHRDITGTNFYIGYWGGVHLIDLELIYSFKENNPNPPFRGGTFGYMSPEQSREEKVSFKDDCFSLGALLLMIIAGGVEPTAFLELDRVALRKKVFYLCRDEVLTQLVMDCTSSNAEERPGAEAVGNLMEQYKRSIGNDRMGSVVTECYDLSVFKDIIRKGINALSDGIMVSDELWFSKVENAYGMDVYPLVDKTFFAPLYRGVGGVIWLLGELRRLGRDVSDNRNGIDKGLQFIQETVLDRAEKVTPSFYYGMGGIALVLVSAMRNGFLPDNTFYREQVQRCFSQPSVSFNVIHGIAGQGLAAMQCRSFLGDVHLNSLLEKYTATLLHGQQADGAWSESGSARRKGDVNSGFGFGIAGIAYFLLEYGAFYKDADVLQAAEKGLDYLIKKAKRKKEYLEWRINIRSRGVGLGWCNGTPGIALAFLKGYELTGNSKYLKVAEKALLSCPRYLLLSDLSQGHGLSGIGEIYLEAFRVTGNQEWWDRATWIANSLVTFKMNLTTDKVYWLVSGPNLPTADFMIGNTGVLHFLLRYINPDKVFYPFLPEPKSFYA